MGKKGAGGKPSDEEIARIREERRQRREEQKVKELEFEQNEGSIWELNYEFTSTSIRLAENWDGEANQGGSLAGIQWVGGVVISRFLDCRALFPDGYWRGRRALELGAGCALPSLLLAKLGAQATISDIDLEKCQPNIDLNFTKEEQEDRIFVKYLCWGDYSNQTEFNIPYDVIIAGDCMYQDQYVEPFLQTTWRFSDENTQIYVCGVVTKSPFVVFCKTVDKYFNIERLDTSCFDGLPFDEETSSTAGAVQGENATVESRIVSKEEEEIRRSISEECYNGIFGLTKLRNRNGYDPQRGLWRLTKRIDAAVQSFGEGNMATAAEATSS